MEVMVGCIDNHGVEHVAEQICRVLPITLFTYCDHLDNRADQARLSEMKDSAERERAAAPSGFR